MSDRRTVTAVVCVLVGLVGIAVVVVAAVALRSPISVTGEGQRMDLTRVLTATIAFGVLLALAGTSTAIAVIRGRLRSGRGH